MKKFKARKIPLGLGRYRLKKMRKKDLKKLGLKTCPDCGLLKWIHLSFTYKIKTYCNTCSKRRNLENARLFKSKNPEKVKRWNKKWYDKNGTEYHREYYKNNRR